MVQERFLPKIDDFGPESGHGDHVFILRNISQKLVKVDEHTAYVYLGWQRESNRWRHSTVVTYRLLSIAPTGQEVAQAEFTFRMWMDNNWGLDPQFEIVRAIPPGAFHNVVKGSLSFNVQAKELK